MMGEDNFNMEMFNDDFEIINESVDNADIINDNTGGDPPNDNISGEDSKLDPEGVAGENEGDGGSEGSDDTSPNIYNSLATVLYEQGLLPSYTDKLEEIKDVNSLTDAFKTEIKTNEYKDLSDTQKEFLESVRSGITQEQFLAYKETENILNNISEYAIEEDIELRKNIIYQDAINNGINENKAAKLVELSISNNTDIEDAAEALKALKTFEKAKLDKIKENNIEKAKLIAEKNAKSEKKVQSLIEKDELFKGLKINEGLRQAAYKTMNTIVSVNNEGVPQNKLMKYQSENPEEFNAKLYTLFELTNGFSDLSKIKTSTSSQVVKDFEEALGRTNFIDKGGQPGFINDSNEYSNTGDELVF